MKNLGDFLGDDDGCDEIVQFECGRLTASESRHFTSAEHSFSKYG